LPSEKPSTLPPAICGVIKGLTAVCEPVILISMTHKVGVKGQVVIPKAIRDRIGIRPGDEVAFDSDHREVRIRRVEEVEADRVDRIRALRGAWSGEGAATAATDALLAERRKERELEERRAEGRGVGRL
jgi:AbrB family looped-hinge helix DNA binding protein